VDQKFINHELRRRNLATGAAGGKRLRRIRRRFLRECAREDYRGADCFANRESGLANWEKILPVEEGKEDSDSRKLVAPAARACDLAGSQKIDYHDARVHTGAGVCAGDGGTSGGRSVCEIAFA